MSLLRVFRYIAILEGISYLLFGVTMPLKYVYEIVEPNYYIGMAHGMLFLLYCALGLSSAVQYKWKLAGHIKSTAQENTVSSARFYYSQDGAEISCPTVATVPKH